jgi:hypothetical protein
VAMIASSNDRVAMAMTVLNCCHPNLKATEWASVRLKNAAIRYANVNLQLRDVELSCFWKLTLLLDDIVGGQYVFRGTETQPSLSPSRELANSRMNFPSEN